MTEAPPTHASTRYLPWRLLAWTIGLLPAIAPIFWPRSFYLGEYLTALRALDAELMWARLLTALALGASVLVAAFGLLARRALPRSGAYLCVAAWSLAAGPIISSVLGLSPGFSPGHFAFPIAVTAIYLSPLPPLAVVLRDLQRVLLVYVYGSLLVVPIAPRWAVEFPYTQGLLPQFSIRLHGLAVHAVPLSALVLAYMLLTMWDSRPSRVAKFHFAVAGVTLVLTQSKTSWLLLLAAYAFRYALAGSGPVRRVKLALLAVLTISSLLLLPTYFDDAVDHIDAQRRHHLTTLTGRTAIWATTLEVLAENPTFGYGPRLWSAEMSLDYKHRLGWAPAQAHSQYLQTLGEAGLLGASLLAVYSAVLVVSAIRLHRRTRGLSSFLVFFWLSRGIVESWYRNAVADGNLLLHLAIFAVLIAASREKVMSR